MYYTIVGTLGFPHQKMKFFKTFQNSGRMKLFLDLNKFSLEATPPPSVAEISMV